MLRVTYCCCGCSLKIGTLLILLYDVLFSWIYVIAAEAITKLTGIPVPDYLVVPAVIVILTGIPALIGVCAEMPNLLLPYLGWQVLTLIGYVILMIVGPFTIGAEIPKKGNTFSEAAGGLSLIYGSDAKNKKYITSDDVVKKEIQFALTFLLTFYFFVVILSHYYELKENRMINYGGGFQGPMQFGGPGPYRPYPQKSPREDGEQ